MSLQLIWPVELLTAACVCPRTKATGQEVLTKFRTLLLAPLLTLSMRTLLSILMAGQRSRAGSEASRWGPGQDKRREGLQSSDLTSSCLTSG